MKQSDGDSALERCQQVLGYRFRDAGLLRAALTHASGADHRLGSNERLEFLGDAVLGFVVCERLYHQFPQALEGELTLIKSHVVSRATCSRISRRLGLERYLILGKGMGGAERTPGSVLADVFESLIGAIYLDGGIEAVRHWIDQHLGAEIEAAAFGQVNVNFKSNLQHTTQRIHGEAPTYELIDERGPDHSKHFKIVARVAGKSYTPAWGVSKKEAEQRAASNALAEISGEPPPFANDP
jgi:ribonuclease-3